MNDVMIIGAGAAGLMAARVLSAKGKKILVLEARERLGGRIHTIENTFSFKAEAGAEFIHGNLKLTKKLLKEAGLEQTKTKGELYRMENGVLKEEYDFVEGWGILIKRLNKLDKDITIKKFLDEYISEEKYHNIKESFKKYVQGYDAADIKNASSFGIREEMENEYGKQTRVTNGYGSLINFFAEEIKNNGSKIETSEVVKQINWNKNEVEVITKSKSYKAEKVVITAPIGVLQTEENEGCVIKFSPQIIEYQKAINNIGFGGVIKILLEFDEAFWFDKKFLKERNIDEPFFIFGEAFIPTWWTQYPDKKPLLIGWLTGPDAYYNGNFTDEKFLKESISSLAKIFKVNTGELQKKLKAHKICNWVNDPFCKGGYSYLTVASKEALRILKMPIENTIYFAGEALAKEGIGTVDAALQSGREVAELIINS